VPNRHRSADTVILGFEEIDQFLFVGANPKMLGVFEVACADPQVDERVKLFRNIFDFEDVFDAFEESRSVAIVGGGFLGSELACALARKG
jgi:programmed cell death 8 (apoptosis-inducing factor)